jgi:ketosteroid isomerase-like protein
MAGMVMLTSVCLPWFRRLRIATVGVLPGRDGYAMAAAGKRWSVAQGQGYDGDVAGLACEPRGRGVMTEVIDRLAAAVNAHDLDAVAGLIHEDYRSEQPAHPGRAFAGRAQMLANWEAMLAGVPDLCVESCRSVQDGDTTWTEWRWSGTRSDGQAFEMRGVTLFEVSGGQIVAGRLYLEDVEQDVVSIEQAVEDLSGRRPRPADQ